MVLNKLCMILVFSLFSTHSVLAATLDQNDFKSLVPLNAENRLPNADSGKKIFMYFWATWCPDCKEKLTGILQKSEVYEKFDVYLIATDKVSEKVQHFQKKFAVHSQIALDPERRIQKALKVFSVPTAVLIERNGDQLIVKQTQTGGDISSLLK